MEWLNYHHLHYFWTVVREGSIAAASRRLLVGRPSISMQIKSLEQSLGESLFERKGRRLELTEAGKTVFGFAEEIFEAGSEMLAALRGAPGGRGRPASLRVGIADVMAKLVAFRLLDPAMALNEPVRLICREDHPRRLFADLAIHELDLVLSDVPLSPELDVKAYSHVLGESTISLFATDRLVRSLRRGFPGSLDGAPFLMPSRDTAVRSVLERWFDDHQVRPSVVGEFDDSALLKVFGQAGHGVFPSPSVVAAEIRRKYQVQRLAELAGTRETFYAVSPERRIQNAAAARIIEHAQKRLFG